MASVLVTPASGYPVTLAEAKASCRVLGNDEDTYLNLLIEVATAHVEQYCGRAILPQVWALHLDAFPSAFMIQRGPMIEVTSVKYYDEANVLQTIDAADYAVDDKSDPAWIVPVTGYSWPTPAQGVNNVIVTYEAGYAVPPAPMKHAILLLVAQWFDNREAASDKPFTAMPNAVEALLANYRSFA